MLALGTVPVWHPAWADFYVIAAGKKGKRTVLVSPRNTQTASGTILLNALDDITDAAVDNPYLIIVEPGVYDIGGENLQMKSYVDIQGAGQHLTKITGNVDSEHGTLESPSTRMVVFGGGRIRVPAREPGVML